MSDTFHSAEITTKGISVKVLRDGVGHRTAIGVGDYDTPADFTAAVASLLTATLGPNLALIAANLAARDDDKAATIAALEDAHAAEVAALQLDLDALGTKEEAQAIRKQQAVAALQAEITAKTAELQALTKAEAAPAEALP